MSDELEEERVYQTAAEYARRVPLSGRLAGAGPMPDDQVEHLGSLWWDWQVRPRAERIPMAAFVAYVYRCARIRESEDAQAREIERNRRLAERIGQGQSAGSEINEIMRYVYGNARAHLHVPGPRAAQLADEITRLRRLVTKLGGTP